MAAQAPREGLEFVPGTSEEVGVELLKHVDDPQDVIAYGGYGFWAPPAAIAKVKGAKAEDLTNGPIAPRTGPHVDRDEYVNRDVDQYGQPTQVDPGQDEVDLKANAPFPEPEGERPEDAAENAGDADEAPKTEPKKRGAAAKSAD